MADGGKYADVPVRIRSWGVIIAIYTVAMLHPLLTAAFAAVLTGMALREIFAMQYGCSAKVVDVTLIVAAGVECWLLYTQNYCAFLYFVAAYFVVVAALSRFVFGGRWTARSCKFLAVALLSIFSLAHLYFIRMLLPGWAGIWLLLFVVVATELNDVFQYLTGKPLGRHKIAPHISPNKTVEGFAGGVVLTTLLCNLLALFLLPMHVSALTVSVVGVLISLLGFGGDIYLSSIKRMAGVKDTSRLIPGHGGLLDRVDSLLFVAPAFYGWAYYFILNLAR